MPQQYPVEFIIQYGTEDANFLVPLMARAERFTEID
jgi:hypothetical protein